MFPSMVEEKTMTTYWLSFTLDSRTIGNRDYNARWNALYTDIKGISIGTNWWTSTTSFIVFETAYGFDHVVQTAKNAVSVSYDTVLIRQLDVQDARIFGPVTDRDIFKLMPYLVEV